MYEFINQINIMEYSKNVIEKVKAILPKGWSLKVETEHPPEIEELWIAYDENNEPKVDVFIMDDPIEIGELMIYAEEYTKVEK